MSEAERRSRAAARNGRMTLRKGRLQAREDDLSPISGADAVSLVKKLTEESWRLAGLEFPTYTRDQIPIRFVPRRRSD